MLARLTALSMVLCISACGDNNEKTKETSQVKAVEDASSIVKRSDGRFNVRCENGTSEIATAQDIRDNTVCESNSSSGNSSCYYSSGSFVVFSDGKAYRTSVDQGSSNSAISCGETVSAYYDGDDLHVFDSATKTFDRNFVDDNAPTATLIARKNGVLFYDGDDVYSYCSGSNFEREFADDNAQVITRFDTNSMYMIVGAGVFSLNLRTCTLTKS